MALTDPVLTGPQDGSDDHVRRWLERLLVERSAAHASGFARDRGYLQQVESDLSAPGMPTRALPSPRLRPYSASCSGARQAERRGPEPCDFTSGMRIV
jgi:hypothetical protein